MKRWSVVMLLLALLLSACGQTSVFDLKTGDCFNDPAENEVASVGAVECSALHDYEIFGTVDHPAGSDAAYPGASAVEEVINSECNARFEPFVGTPYEDSELYIYYLAPTEESWGDGDREILCALYLPDEQLQGSMEGSER